jgi:hypothetical protein
MESFIDSANCKKKKIEKICPTRLDLLVRNEKFFTNGHGSIFMRDFSKPWEHLLHDPSGNKIVHYAGG